MTCHKCDHPLVPKHWPRPTPNHRRHAGLGLCSTCYNRERTGATYRARRWVDIADDYALLRAEGYPLEVIAERMGMTFDALDKQLERHRDDDRARRPGTRCAA